MFWKKTKNKKYYFDHAAGTPISKSVFLKMQKYFEEDFYNPGGIYWEAFAARDVLSGARKNIAKLLSTQSKNTIFCDGGTEANNLALRGFVKSFRKKEGRAPLFLVGSIEHASVLETAKDLEKEGLIKLILLPVNEHAEYDLKILRNILREEEIDFISLSFVNGEVGTIQDIGHITKLVRHHRKHKKRIYPIFHTDAIQAANYLALNIQKMGVDMMTLNASKIYGPKKMALLYKKPGVEIEPIITGGDQEFSLRAGTENIPYIVGFEKALSETFEMRDREFKRLSLLQKYFEDSLKDIFGDTPIINGKRSARIPNIVNISFADISHEEIVLRLDACSIQASVKSACKSDQEGDSHVILGMRDYQTQSLRFSMGRETGKKDIDYLLKNLQKIVFDMREVYEKYYAS